MENKKRLLSFVIPVLNEQGNIGPLCQEIQEAMVTIDCAYELIFIDDGSRDKTWSEIKKLESRGLNLKGIRFRRNFGKAEAYKAGFEITQGETIITMDGDLQDNPADIPNFIQKIEGGYDLVSGWKHKRVDGISKVISSRVFNWILRRLTKLKLHDFDNGYRCFKREIIPYLNIYAGLYRYIPLFAHMNGFKVGEIKVNHRKRYSGKSKYKLTKIFSGLFDLITIKFLYSYARRPLHFFGGIGSTFCGVGLVIALYLSYLRLFLNQSIGSRPLLILSVLLVIVGVQLVVFGILGEIMVHNKRKNKNYSIQELI